MATVPSSATDIRFLSGIPWSNDYKHARWFDTKTEQTNYFFAKPIVHSMSNANFVRQEGKMFISVGANIDELWGTSYVMFQNEAYNSRWFYAFVTKLEYKQTKTTYVHFEIDIFQTWKFEMNFKPSFVIREHCKLWNTDGSPVINTVDEGLDYGHDYETVAVEECRPYKDVHFLIIVAKASLHDHAGDHIKANEITPIMNGVPQPLSYYVHPFKLDGSIVNVSMAGNDIGLSNILSVVKVLSIHDDAVNNIVSMYITDYIGSNTSYDESTNTMTFSAINYNKATISFDGVDGMENLNTISVSHKVIYTDVEKTFSNKYSGYNSVTESKLLMHPYTSLVLDDLKGNRMTLKNEYILSDDITIMTRGSMGTSNKTVYSVVDYLTKSSLDGLDKLSASFEHALINNNPSDIPIVTDMLSAFLQGNRNSIEAQKNSIMFNGFMGNVGSSIGGGASLASQNPMSKAVGGVSAGAEIVQGAGNAVLQLQAIEAKQKDINNTPPQLAKMGNNTNFDYGNGIAGLYIIKKQIKSEYRNKLTSFFNMYGYKFNEVKVPNFHTRRYWNYVQTASCVITGDFNNEDLNELKAVFDNGITFWHTDDVGNYTLGNEVL